MSIKNTIQAADDRPLEAFPVDEWGVEVFLRPFAGDDVILDDPESLTNKDAMWMQLRVGICNADGNPLFDDSDREWVMKKNVEVLQRIQKRLNKISGLSGDDEKKDSGKEETGDSPTG